MSDVGLRAGKKVIYAKHLIASGYDARSVAGGTLAWVRSGRPVVEGREPGRVLEGSHS